jgi:hypothetical protein
MATRQLDSKLHRSSKVLEDDLLSKPQGTLNDWPVYLAPFRMQCVVSKTEIGLSGRNLRSLQHSCIFESDEDIL